jgi:hypothetical protein
MPKVPALKARFIPEPFRSIIGTMPQSLSKVIIHIIFSTKSREPWLDSDMRPHARLSGRRSAATWVAKPCAWAVSPITFTSLRRCGELFPRLSRLRQGYGALGIIEQIRKPFAVR